MGFIIWIFALFAGIWFWIKYNLKYTLAFFTIFILWKAINIGWDILITCIQKTRARKNKLSTEEYKNWAKVSIFTNEFVDILVSAGIIVWFLVWGH